MGAYGSNKQPLRLGVGPPAPFTTRRSGTIPADGTHRCCSASRPEKDFLVTERIWFPCRNLGKNHRTSWSGPARVGGTSRRGAGELTASSASPGQRKARSCPRWPRRSRSFGGPFRQKQRDHAAEQILQTTADGTLINLDVALHSVETLRPLNGYSKQLWDERGVLFQPLWCHSGFSV